LKIHTIMVGRAIRGIIHDHIDMCGLPVRSDAQARANQRLVLAAQVGMVGLYSPREPTIKTAQHTFTVEQTDELILAACKPEDGAIEDCEIGRNAVRYFFQTGAVGIVSLRTGKVKSQEPQN
jgi:hypothetical protein